MQFRRTFITGLVIILPVWVTYWVVSLIFGEVNSTVTPLIFRVISVVAPAAVMPGLRYLAPIVSVLLAVCVIVLVGLVGGNVLGRQLLRFFESLLLRIPFVRGIYSATRQFIDTFSRPEGSAFRRTVLVEFPRPGVWTLGFLTNDAQTEIQARTSRDLVSVFVPTTPNPTGGYVIFVARSTLIELSMSVDDAFKMIISGGVLAPAYSAPIVPQVSAR